MVNVGRRAEHAHDTRAAVVQAAEQLFAERGFAAATIDDVAEQARVTKGAVYHHFDGKQDLFRAVVEQLYQRLVVALADPPLEQRLSMDADLWDVICAAYQARLDHVSVDPAFQRIVDQDALAVLGYEVLQDIAQSIANVALLPVLEEAIETGIIKPMAAETLARLLGALVAAAGREIAIAGDPDRARREVGQALDSFLQGLRGSA